MTDTSTQTPTAKPAHTLRLGTLQAAIWCNAGQHGHFYNVTFERRYRDAQEEWQSSASYGRDDLLLLAKLADQAHSWVCDRLSQEREQAPASTTEPAAATRAASGRRAR
jgi:hypothetical protein